MEISPKLQAAAGFSVIRIENSETAEREQRECAHREDRRQKRAENAVEPKAS
jgi:hypothetical protein